MFRILSAFFVSSIVFVSLGQEIEKDSIIAQTTNIQPDSSTLSLLFIGDIMGHQSQINAAFDENIGTYSYDSCFKYIDPVISSADVAIANLEVTLAGWPYQGYPQFSSPDALAIAMKNAGVDIFVTANNHSNDRRQQGVERTINVLDSLDIGHTGTFSDSQSREETYPYFIEKNGFKIALLNYTYATNGIPTSPPNIVNLINKHTLETDLENARFQNPDHIIVFMHWGEEYNQSPSGYQLNYYQQCLDAGADLIIGSHPHVVQKMELKGEGEKRHVVAFSLGNFISNQRTHPRDGGALLQVNLSRKNGISRIENAGYHLTWVYPPTISKRKKFYVLPISQFEQSPEFMDNSSFQKMRSFATGSRQLFDKENIAVPEIIFSPSENENTPEIQSGIK